MYVAKHDTITYVKSILNEFMRLIGCYKGDSSFRFINIHGKQYYFLVYYNFDKYTYLRDCRKKQNYKQIKLINFLLQN